MPPRFTPIVEIAPGSNLTGSSSSWSWTDLTMQDRVHNPSGISIRRGRGDRMSSATSDACNLTLINTSGWFVPRNPLGPWYGSLTKGTPLRVLVQPQINSASDAFGRTVSGGFGTADSGGAYTVVGTAGDYATSTTNGGRMTHSSANVAHIAVLSASVLRVDLRVKVRVNATSTGAAQSTGLVFRYTDASNYQCGVVEFGTTGTLTARIVSRVAGVETPGTGVTVSGLTHSTSTWYWIRVQTGLNSVRMKVWADGTTEPATWTLDGSTTVLAITTAGQFGMYSRRETGNTNSSATFDFDNFSMQDGPRIQFTGFVDEWPVRWNDAGLAQAFAPITANGQLQRLSRSRPLKSAITQTCTSSVNSATSSVVAYWSMEDGSTAQSFASSIGGKLQTFTGSVSPGADSQVVGSDPLPTFGGTGSVRFAIPAYTASTTWAVRWLMKIPASSISSSAQIMSWTVQGGSPIVRWQMTLTPGTPDVVSLSGWNQANTVVFAGSNVNFVDATSSAELSDGRQLYWEVSGTQNGGNIDTDWTCWYMADDGSGAQGLGATQSTASTNGNVTLVYHDAATGFGNGGHTIGHVLLATDTGAGASSTGVTGNAGDFTDTRLLSICSDQNIVTLFGDLVRGVGTTTQTMGAQRSGDIMSQLQEIEDTEAGTLYDGKQAFVHLLPRSMKEARPVDLTLDASLGQVGWPLEPTDDDQLLQNDITVNNVGGSNAIAKDLTSIAAQGVRTLSASVNTYKDSDLQLHADWRLAVGTTQEMRYPAIVLNLTRHHLTLASAWCDADIGSRIQVTNLPAAELPPEDLDLLIDGYTEYLSSDEWVATLNCSPATPWTVGVLDTNRLDCAASTTAGSLTTGATSVPVAWADACNWTHADGDYPIVIGGERMTVTAVADVLDDNFGRTTSNGWGSADTGQAWTTNGGSASDYSVGSGAGKHSLGTVGTERLTTADIGSSTVSFFVDVAFGVTTALTSAIRLRIAGRGQDANNYYLAQLELGTDSVVRLSAQKRVAGTVSALTSGGSSVVVDTNTSGSDSYRVTLTVIGSTITATAARSGGARASTSGTDTTFTTGTLIGLGGVLLAGNTNTLPVVLSWDHLTVGNPQVLTVVRSVNGIVKTHAAGEEVHVASPIILAL